MTRARRPIVGAALAALTAALAAPAASAAPAYSGRVVLLDPPGSGATARHCLTRIREELVAGGFEVSLLDPGPHLDPISLAGVMERQEGAVAIIALLGDPDQPGTELWILDRVGAAPEVRRIPAASEDHEHLPEVLAIRTIEVLKASALKLLLESTQPAPPVTAAVAVASRPAARPPASFGFEAGLSVLESVGGPGPAAVPLLRVRAVFADFAFMRLTAAGLGSRPRVETLMGSAAVGQSFGLGELGIALRPGRRWRPAFSVGGGIFYAQSDGQGTWPYQGLQQARWTAALDAGAGLSTSLGDELSLAFEIHGLLAVPHPTVRFYDLEAATIGFPALFASLTMIAWL